MKQVDLVIRNGRIIDPSTGKDFSGDIAVHDGKILSIGDCSEVKGDEEFNATGCIVTPGLIDCHVHCYQYATPLGVDPDGCCLSRGVTTVVDAGSAGSSTFPGLRKFIAESSRTRVLCFLHIANHGMAAAGCTSGAGGGESDSLNALNVEECSDRITQNRDMIIGVKVRLSDTITDNGKNEQEAFRRALEAGKKCNVPVMIHHTMSTVPKQGTPNDGILCCPRDLRQGDIHTHTFSPNRSCIIDSDTRKIVDDVIEAQKRGVYMDVGHGQGSFSWTVAEICAESGFWPDIISTDLHTGNSMGPVYDLPSVMSKFLHLGMSLNDIIRSVTMTPAKAINMSDSIGSLTEGREADITILRIDDVTIEVEDCQSQTRTVKRWIFPTAVWRAGVAHTITKPETMPNVEAMKLNAAAWHDIVIKDPQPPKIL